MFIGFSMCLLFLLFFIVMLDSSFSLFCFFVVFLVCMCHLFDVVLCCRFAFIVCFIVFVFLLFWGLLFVLLCFPHCLFLCNIIWLFVLFLYCFLFWFCVILRCPENSNGPASGDQCELFWCRGIFASHMRPIFLVGCSFFFLLCTNPFGWQQKT